MASLDPDKIREVYTTRVADIKGRRDLSDAGKRRQLAKVWVKAADDMRAARAASETSRATREKQLLRRLFGNQNSHDATSVVSFRDAQDRAERLKTPAEAGELLARARRSGDVLLARALAMKALDMAVGGTPGQADGWGNVLNVWSADEPGDVDDALTELSEFHGQGPAALVGLSAQHSVPKPTELAGVGNLHALAREADATPGEDEPAPAPGSEFFTRGGPLLAGQHPNQG